MSSLSVVVASYGSYVAASADWGDVDCERTDAVSLIDAVLIEWSDGRVAKVLRCSSQGSARGSVACALVGRLSPSALLDGAIAGGVGKRALHFVSTGLSRDAVNELGRVMESGRFVTLAILERRSAASMTNYGARALGLARLPMQGTSFDLHHAVQADEADE